MNVRSRKPIFLALCAGACATAGGGGGGKALQADHMRPQPRDFGANELVEQQLLTDAVRHVTLADAAQGSGNSDQAQAENRAAAELFASFADRFPTSEYRLVMRRSAAERYLLGGAPEKAAEQASKIVVDPEAEPRSKAIAGRLQASAWQQVAAAETRAGKIEKLALLTASQRKGQEPKPRPLPVPWKRFVEAVDAYLPIAGEDPAQKLPAEERRTQGLAEPVELALIAAEVEYAYDNLEDARGRFERIINGWPGEASVMENAVPLYLQTFLVLKDDQGFDAAIPLVKGIIAAEAKKAQAAAESNATEEQKKAADIYARLDDQLAKQLQGAGYTQGERLLAVGKYQQAAGAFEKFAAENSDSPDAPNALYNAAIAWDKAKEPKKAQADRERLVQLFPDAKVAPAALVAQASSLSRTGEHSASEKLYWQYLQKWPQGEQRCLAMYNRGVELNSQNRQLEAAGAFITFGTDEKCAREDPKAAAQLLYNAAGIYTKAKKRNEARSALKAMLALPPVSDVVVQSWIDDAKKKLSAMK